MKENKDCPAMPLSVSDEHFQHPNTQYFGLSKREAFTMAVLQGLCANPDIMSLGFFEEIKDGLRGGRPLVTVAERLADIALEDKK